MKGLRFPRLRQKREKDLHKDLKKYGEGLGGTCIKLTTLAMYGVAGFPDQLWLFPGAIIFFIELKRDEKEECTDLQLARQATLRRYGFHVSVVSDLDKGKTVIRAEIQKRRAS